ncbi:TonB-dependent receptor plug domain-containing protein [Mongoliitalea daihaiensis]|uniref:TonB-dependent receptor plug domain-containing protein n=1 Tax=Mongoliitalea daihaiensis TaxID=2782006 RepID=UPI001F1B14BB|nr:TonB-dependent receptor plug domain-containing protein [Mongoliitalea daihaiensis]UJP66313.1 TonB-dependent receptor plug domain-containing protein [Mongoliitalea daihaiensis]
MKSRFTYLFPVIFLLLLIFSAYQNKNELAELTERILNQTESYTNDFPEEKVFVHIDRSNYAAGDYIWFSVFLTAGSPDIPSPLSKVVYVDLLDNEGNLLQQSNVRIKDGHGEGSFRLDIYASEGTYHLKAYSYWMKGFGEEAVFQTSIQVLEPYNLKFQPNAVFNFMQTGTSVTYQVDISALNRSLQSISNEELIFELVQQGKTLQSGKFTTDQNGKHNLNFTLQQQDLEKLTALVLIQQENEEYSISRKFILPTPLSVADIQFLPEGGDLIAGFPNRVAVRAVSPTGDPIQVKGSIALSDETLEFSTNESGLGSFSFTPQVGESYNVQFNKDNEIVLKSLPKVLDSGVNLTVDNLKEGVVNVLIQASNFNAFSASGEGLLVVHARGRVGHMQKINLSAGVSGARIQKAQLAPGINQVTVFEPSGTPLAERLIFIPQDNKLNLSLDPGNVNLTARGKNSWKVRMDGESFEGGFYSMAITDANESPGSFASNIISYLKLESELKGAIHNPKDLFSKGENMEAIDLILLTHGWRRFDWEKVLAGEFGNEHFIEQGINITGTVLAKEKGRRGISGGSVTAFLKGKSEEFVMAEFTDNGRFIIDDMDFQDTSQLVLTVQDRRLKEFVNLELDKPVAKYEQWKGFNPLYETFEINPIMRDYLANAEKRRQVSAAFDGMSTLDIGEFVVSAQKIKPEDDNITRVFGKGDVSVKPQDIPGYEGYYDIWQLLQGRLAGVRIVPNPVGGTPNITIRGTGSLNPLSPIFLLDNVPVDADVISTIAPSNVASIEVFKDGASLAIFGASGAGGALAVYTKRGSGLVDVGDGVFNLQYPGYTTAREFYIPKYDKENDPRPDFRSTLYWSPKLTWTGNEATVEFFNNDYVEKFKVIIQGIDKFGRISYLEQEIGG